MNNPYEEIKELMKQKAHGNIDQTQIYLYDALCIVDKVRQKYESELPSPK